MLLRVLVVVPVVQAQVRRASAAAVHCHRHRQLALRPGKIHPLLPSSAAAPAPLQICNGVRARTNKQLNKQQEGEVNAKTTAWSFQAMMYEKQESDMPWEAQKK
jgi:hypothetical protein